MIYPGILYVVRFHSANECIPLGCTDVDYAVTNCERVVVLFSYRYFRVPVVVIRVFEHDRYAHRLLM